MNECIFRRSLRETIRSKIIYNLWLTLFFFNVFFMLGLLTHTVEDSVLCKVVAAALHYLMLSSLTWLTFTTFHLHGSMLNHLNPKAPYFFMTCFCIAWGLPALSVCVTLVAEPDNYGPDHTGICWLQGAAVGLAMVGPLSAVLLLNSVPIILICIKIINLHVKSRQLGLAHIKVLKSFATYTGMLLLLAFTWSFAVVAVGNTNQFLNYLFAFFNTCQSIYIFALYCVASDSAMNEWYRFFGCSRKCINEPDMTLDEKRSTEIIGIHDFVSQAIRVGYSVASLDIRKRRLEGVNKENSLCHSPSFEEQSTDSSSQSVDNSLDKTGDSGAIAQDERTA
ncbi:adhesion G-protein coupled receptor G2-like, partial [Physella acuta]|uniref:adhesion G-protein coupled receptor G2-like n=1 Tax=Physella acuta TaxID=109671 RepID=UPI0027DD4AF3